MSSINVCIVNKSLYRNENCQNAYPHKERIFVKILGVNSLSFQNDIVIELKTDDKIIFVSEDNFYSVPYVFCTTILGNLLRISCTEKGRSEIDLGEYSYEVQQGSSRTLEIKVYIDGVEIRGNIDKLGLDGNDIWSYV